MKRRDFLKLGMATAAALAVGIKPQPAHGHKQEVLDLIDPKGNGLLPSSGSWLEVAPFPYIEPGMLLLLGRTEVLRVTNVVFLGLHSYIQVVK